MPFNRMTVLLTLAFVATPCADVLAAPSLPGDFSSWSLDPPVSTPAITAPWTPVVEAPATLADETAPAAKPASRLRRMLADFSMSLRHIRYKRGGRDPSTGFDCSGFVRYVFRHGAGTELPSDSASQYRTGKLVAKQDMKTGDLVFFRIKGKRVSHVGIYLGDGRFIHAPSAGKAVSISRLDQSYWSKRFVGAKRPEVLG
jgi:cell wall-associated NlpC family hydrolase